MVLTAVTAASRWLPAGALFLVLAAIHTWSLATGPHLSFQNDDEWLNAWAVAWIAHQIPRDPLHLFDANMFHPRGGALAYTEPLIVPGLMAAPIHWLGGSPLFAHNVLVFAGLTLTALATYWLVRDWTGDRRAGLLSGALFAFSTPFITRIPHVQALHAYWLPLALVAFQRLMAYGRARHAAWLGLCVIGAALTSGYLMVFLFFALAAAAVARAPAFLGREGVRVLMRLGAAAAATLAVLLLLMRPYLDAENRRPPIAETPEITTALSSYLASAAHVHYRTWSGEFYHRAPGALFPGCVALVLAGVALCRRRRAAPCGTRRLLLAVGGIGVLLSLGSHTPFYLWAYEVFPPLQGLRAVNRFGVLLVFATAVLAGIGLSGCTWPAPARRRTLVAFILIALATVENFHGPFAYSRFDYAGSIHRSLGTSSWPGAVLELPIYGFREFHRNARYLLASTAHWRPLVNGFGGFAPPDFDATVQAARQFPSAPAVAWLQDIGVGYVVVHLDAFPDPMRALRSLTRLEGRRDLTLEAVEGATRLYRVRSAKARAIAALTPAPDWSQLRFVDGSTDESMLRAAGGTRRAFGFQSPRRFIGYIESTGAESFVALQLPVPMSGRFLDATTGAVLQGLAIPAREAADPPVRVVAPPGHHGVLFDLHALRNPEQPVGRGQAAALPFDGTSRDSASSAIP